MSSVATADPAAAANLSIDATAATFDKMGAAYEDAWRGNPSQRKSLEWVLEQLGDGKRNVLDIGCGTGKPAVATLAEAGHAVTGVDISETMVAIARAQVPSARIEVGDGRTWEPPRLNTQGEGADGYGYDGVVAYFSFIAGVTQADIRRFFVRAYSWLRPGGCFAFGTVPIEGEGVAIKWLGRDVVVSSLSGEETVSAIKDAGFEVVKHETSTFWPKAAEAGLCAPEDVWEEPEIFVYAIKK